MKEILGVVLLVSVLSLEAASFRAFEPVVYPYFSVAGYLQATNNVSEVRGLSADGSTVVVGLARLSDWARIRVQATEATATSIPFHYYSIGTGGLGSNGDSLLTDMRYSYLGAWDEIGQPFFIKYAVGVGISGDGQTLAGQFTVGAQGGGSDGPGFFATSNGVTRVEGTVAVGLSVDGQVLGKNILS